ncbi:hypothetical protein [Dyella telluris]|uniref:Uncharacterized protein n=1 Tax=Dyella telluris TaxID=2763498 RepID=A0A7G8Q4N1_9GAMM|nr:hypothetical protein [Dyella telluris]QNK01739.1 hypothetical protein H8F01_00735 [Dyella telluris]
MTTFMGKLLEDHKMAGFKHRGQAEQAMEAFRKLTEFAEYEPRYFIKEGR